MMNKESDNIIKAQVSGDSMSPLYLDGEIIEIDTAIYRELEPVIGDDVLFKHPYQKYTYILKRIAEITADNRYYVLGLNPKQSTDSRSFGSISRESIIGKVISPCHKEK